MKKLLTTLVLSLVLTCIAIAAQNSSSSAAKKPKPKPAVNCSSVDDTKLAGDVQTRLGNAPSLKGLTISAQSKDGVVTLTGSVKTGRQKGTAGLIARRAPCVKKVDNQLTVTPGSN